MYTDSELDEIERDFEFIARLWQLYLHEKINGNTEPSHAPPALAKACQSITNIAFGEEVHFSKTSALSVEMFLFGQFAMKNGLLAANMNACKCDHVDDEELKKFLDN